MSLQHSASECDNHEQESRAVVPSRVLPVHKQLLPAPRHVPSHQLRLGAECSLLPNILLATFGLIIHPRPLA